MEEQIDPQYLADSEWRFVCFDIKSTSWKRLQRENGVSDNKFPSGELVSQKKSNPELISSVHATVVVLWKFLIEKYAREATAKHLTMKAESLSECIVYVSCVNYLNHYTQTE